MDEFARAELRREKQYERRGIPQQVAEAAAISAATDATAVTATDEPQEKSEPAAPAEPTRKDFTRLAVAITNGDETYMYEFYAPDLLENMMHSDRSEAGVKDKLLAILRSHLTTGIR